MDSFVPYSRVSEKSFLWISSLVKPLIVYDVQWQARQEDGANNLEYKFTHKALIRNDWQ